MEQTFFPACVPPAERPGGGWLFAFCGDQLLVLGTEGEATIPHLAEAAALELPVTVEHYLGWSRQHGHCYAVELVADTQPPPGTSLSGLRQLYGRLDEEFLWLGGRAVQVVNWRREHRFCGRCGSHNRPHAHERAMVCDDCQTMVFPRLSPAIIVLVRRGPRLLLARSHRFPPGRYSTIAGFVEPGETVEEAVVREVREEVGLTVGNLRYFGSQSWPFPHSLMLGFVADWVAGEITLHDHELEDAGWYERDRLPDLPDGLSISRRLIDAFLADGAAP
jgi:NAD+ diphosphatase